jgi:argininosuccinate synthase
MNKILLAYSGDLATSIAIPWLARHEAAEVVTLTLDVGGAPADDIRDRALAIGAARAHVIDAREEFARDFVLPALQADALRDGRSPIAAELARPLIAKHLITIAEIEGVSTVAHAGSAHALSMSRISRSVRALHPSMAVIAVVPACQLSRDEMIDYARERGIPVAASADAPEFTDLNLWGGTAAGGVLNDLSREPPEACFALTKAIAETPDTPAYVELEFERGVPTQINRVPMPLVELIQSLEAIAGAHGAGRLESLEGGDAAPKLRRLHEAPAALALHVAHRELQRLVTSDDLVRLTTALAVEYADLVHAGQWYSDARTAIDALVAGVQEKVTGVIRLRFQKGQCEVVARSSPHAAGPFAGVSGATQAPVSSGAR